MISTILIYFGLLVLMVETSKFMKANDFKFRKPILMSFFVLSLTLTISIQDSQYSDVWQSITFWFIISMIVDWYYDEMEKKDSEVKRQVQERDLYQQHISKTIKNLSDIKAKLEKEVLELKQEKEQMKKNYEQSLENIKDQLNKQLAADDKQEDAKWREGLEKLIKDEEESQKLEAEEEERLRSELKEFGSPRRLTPEQVQKRRAERELRQRGEMNISIL